MLLTGAVLVAVILVVLGMLQEGQKGSSAFTEPTSSATPSTNSKTRIQYPANKLDLTNWKITLPIDRDSDNVADEVKQPQLQTFAFPPYFMLAQSGVAFRAYADGSTTDNSGYPRSELREMTDKGQKKAAWSSTSGSHSMTIEQAITHLPAVKRQVVAGQIHDAEDDVMMIRLEGARLFVEAQGKNIGDLNPDYRLGEKFVVKIIAENGVINVFYDNVQKVAYDKAGSGYYFKAGCYTQTNIDKGDSASSYGEVVIYNLQVSHI